MGKQILLAEDDLDDRMLFEEVFSDLPSEDYQLITVCDGEEVLEWLGKLDDSSALPHLIILDHSMPLRNGRDTLSYLKKSPVYSAIPVIIYSSFADKRFSDECEALGVSAMMLKPNTYADYVQMINTFLKYTTAPAG